MPPTVNVSVAQVTLTLRTSPLPTVPRLFAIVHVCDGLGGGVAHRHLVLTAAQVQVVEEVAAIGGDRARLAVVLAQDQAIAQQAADRAADPETGGRARHCHVRHVGAGHGAARVAGTRRSPAPDCSDRASRRPRTELPLGSSAENVKAGCTGRTFERLLIVEPQLQLGAGQTRDRPPIVKLFVMHVTVMFVTFAVPDRSGIVVDRAALRRVRRRQSRPVTLYMAPDASSSLNWNEPLPLMVRSLRPLFRRTSPIPTSPETVTPIENVPVAQVTVTLVTSAGADRAAAVGDRARLRRSGRLRLDA